jgi:hypothetical protein
MEQLSPLKILSLSSLPSASDNAGALVRVGGTLYWSNGSNWLQVAPSSGGGSSFSGARVRRNNFTVANVTWTTVSYNTEAFDTDNYWNSGQPTRITIPATGYYMVLAHTDWETDSEGRYCRVFFNGNTNNNAPIYYQQGSQAKIRRPHGVNIFQLSAGDYFETQLYHDSGDATEDVYSHELTIVRLG